VQCTMLAGSSLSLHTVPIAKILSVKKDGGLLTHGIFVPRNCDAGILTFGLRGVAFDAGPLTRGKLTHGDF
jgi:hypothetical protein